MRGISTLIDKAITELKFRGVEAAETDADYREAWAKRFLAAKAVEGRMTNDEARAWGDVDTSKLRVDAKVAEALAVSAKQALYAYTSQLSALQSAAAAIREEASFARTGPF